MEQVGFVGVGTLSTAMVRGLRARWPDRRIHLSPRSEAASRRLAEADPLVTRHVSNAAVVEASDVVVLAMLPSQIDEALRGISFRRGQVVLNCVAGTSLAEVSALVAPAAACRVIPLPAIARHRGPILLHRAPPVIAALFDGMGDLIEAPDEAAFRAYAAGSAVMSTFFTLQAAMVLAMERLGAPGDGASLYVRSLLGALSETAVLTRSSDLAALPLRHETPGGLNERVRRHLEGQGWFDAVGGAYESIATLRRDDLKADPDA